MTCGRVIVVRYLLIRMHDAASASMMCNCNTHTSNPKNQLLVVMCSAARAFSCSRLQAVSIFCEHVSEHTHANLIAAFISRGVNVGPSGY